ncbi:1-acyl-sn-glycerol-3-phosphate acyltransferase [Dongshaea marina]|uniref:1-acyl-sn-glycerol-3-phosphate acyltransferase n=1 Tax=Dongshaea marina TaxID=2047966 RepID=UPI001901D717|nr:1-acyl-sn-glycerol-3-phosphate acyltransferase [Dongshaea marina]
MTDGDQFSDIRPYNDDEVKSAIKDIIHDREFLSVVAKYRYPKLYSAAPWLLRPLISLYLKKKWGGFESVYQVQLEVERYMEHIIASSTDGVTYSGLDRLDPSKAYLFISNHRDISMDPAFVNLGLHRKGMDTVRIAIGDNLLKTDYATALMRLNKSFIVRRSAKGPREMMRAFDKLSAYIRHSIEGKHSIWIAQKEGRAKDGDDQTDPAILKMFYMNGKKQKVPFADYIRSLNLVPVSISYEYDPGDAAKANELLAIAREGSYQKSELEDIRSIAQGISGFKGRIHVAFGEQMTGDYQGADELAAAIDEAIHKNYHLFPSNYLAAGEDHTDITHEDRSRFNQHIAAIPQDLREQVLSMYAKPLQNQQQYQETPPSS